MASQNKSDKQKIEAEDTERVTFSKNLEKHSQGQLSSELSALIYDYLNKKESPNEG